MYCKTRYTLAAARCGMPPPRFEPQSLHASHDAQRPRKSEKLLRYPHPDPDKHQTLITSRGSPLAHAYHVWSSSISVFVSYPAHRMTNKTITLLRQPRPTPKPTGHSSPVDTAQSRNWGQLRYTIQQQHLSFTEQTCTAGDRYWSIVYLTCGLIHQQRQIVSCWAEGTS